MAKFLTRGGLLGGKRKKAKMSAEERALQEWVRNRLMEAARRFRDEYSYAVRPILLERNEIAEIVGSAVLFRVAGRSFALTAAHVAAAAAEGALLLGSTRAAWYLPVFTGTTAGGDAPDPHDIAFTELQPDLASHFDDCRFITPEELDLEAQLTSGVAYSLIGFPNRSQNRDGTSFSPSGTLFSNVGLEENAYARVFIPSPARVRADPKLHILLSFPRNVIGEAGTHSLGDQSGISGGGVWRRADLSVAGGEPKLAGIVLGAQLVGTRAVCATRIAVMVDILRHARPELDAYLPRPSSVIQPG